MFGIDVLGWDFEWLLICGGSVIVGLFGDLLMELLIGEVGFVIVCIDIDEFVKVCYDFDVVGYYVCVDVFLLYVDEWLKWFVVFGG